jgi:hypothetical protein
MNEIQLYSVIMFFTGVTFSHLVFYFDRKIKLKKFFIFMSASILQVLENIDLAHKTHLQFIAEESKIVELSEKDEYLSKESQKFSALMELYTLLLITSVPKSGRRLINYRSWAEAKVLIQKMRGLVKNEKGHS